MIISINEYNVLNSYSLINAKYRGIENNNDRDNPQIDPVINAFLIVVVFESAKKKGISEKKAK